jgi:hypothetical protein
MYRYRMLRSLLLMPAVLKRYALLQKPRHLLKLPRWLARVSGWADVLLAVIVAHALMQAEADRAEARRLEEARRVAEAAARVCVCIHDWFLHDRSSGFCVSISPPLHRFLCTYACRASALASGSFLAWWLQT